jgi:hypothetical protein
MATYTTQTVIEPADLTAAAEPDAVITRAEESVRTTLAGTSTEPTGEVVLGWLARSVSGTVPWDPRTEAVPDGANYLICRGRRTV